ncbi:MAG: glycosyltransferase, partial [Armatimonadota bacterium]|nr:glycosyltransferase [Armatimonadota bacterium]
TDVFFAGALGNSTVRVRGAEQLRGLAARGFGVDLAEPNLPPAEYFARCARAWLTWSPEGLGWDCFRHYEAAACGSVPLVSRPSIHRYQPLQHGVHCVCYDVEGDGLERAITEALGNKERLMAMARAAREHVLRHHTHRRLCEYVIEATLREDGQE